MNQEFWPGSKRTIGGMLSITLAAVLLAGCGNQGATGGEGGPAPEGGAIKIGVAFKTLREEVWESERAQLEKRDQESPDVELFYTDAGNDATLQNDQIENLISRGIDVLLVAPVDFDGAAAGVAAAKAEGIPVISYTDVVKSNQLDYIVTFDYHAIGIENAKRAVAAVPSGNYVLLNGEEADSLPHDINAGYMEVLQPYIDKGDIKVVFDQYMPHWSGDAALAAMENALTKNANDIQAVICNNDGIASGAIQALTGQGLAGKVYVAGMDGEATALQRVAEGTQDVTVYTGHAPYADVVFDTAVAVARGETPAGITGEREVAGAKIPVIQADPVYVTQDNLYETMISSGIAKVEDVYANVPKDQWPTE